jgi:3-deoxy-manno-octulosonate cytidylyltransferase (CMP-KDO synthetase)
VKIIGIIPARFASTRFPGKPLVDIQGTSMIHHVLQRVHAAGLFDGVWVATDDARIQEHVESLGYRAIMTSSDHPSGTDRCAEALAKCGMEADAVVNIQGDEPLVHASQLEMLAQLIAQPQVDIATLIKPISESVQVWDSNKVKVVTDIHGKALYFSRQAIPLVRGVAEQDWLTNHAYFKHLGLYAYKTEVLQQLVQLPVSSLERAESLEQLRWLENGFQIYTGLTHIETPAIDTPQDLASLLSNWPEE